MGKKLTLAWMLVVALSIIVPLTGATMYAEGRPAVTAPLSVALEINVDAADVALVYRATPGSIVELEAPSACSVGGSIVLPTVGSYLRHTVVRMRSWTDLLLLRRRANNASGQERRALLLWRHPTLS